MRLFIGVALNLLNSLGKSGVSYGLTTSRADVNDTEYLSRYFVVSEFNPTFTAGKNAFAFNGSQYLENGSEVFIECLDSTGQNLFIEMAQSGDSSTKVYAYKEGTAWVFAIHVYNDTQDGVGKIMLWGTLNGGKTVKWSQNITINKTLKNVSRVRFYQAPTLEVESAVVPVLSSSISTGLVDDKTFTGTAHGMSIIPTQGTDLSSINRNTNVDYRLEVTYPVITNSTPDSDAFNSQLIGSTVNLIVNKIKQPNSTQEITPTITTASFIVSDVVNNTTLKVSSPYSYKDSYGKSTVTDISDANFSIHYPFINYNNLPSAYQTSTVGSVTYIIKDSYADIIYKNIRPFSGYVARHKVYRKSLVSNADFSVIADEPVTVNEILADDLTQNKYYYLLGKFYNDEHIARYWFTSSNNLSLNHSPSVAVNSAFLSSPSPTSLIGNDYLMVKNDSVNTNRNAVYVPFDHDQFLAESGSAYDSNFMALKANVQYIIEVYATALKGINETNASIDFYFTSSIPEAKKEPTFTDKFGVKVATLTLNQQGKTSINIDRQMTFFVPSNDLYGTLVIVPKLCQTYIKNISFRVYGDDGFSPDTFISRIPWDISVANETFEIKAELFDINQTLVYSDLRTITSFDPYGASLNPYVPSGGGAGDLTVNGTLHVTQDAIIDNIIYNPNIIARPTGTAISQSRILSVRADGALVFDPMVDMSLDDKYLYLSLGSPSSRLATTITTKKSLASEYGITGGRKIYWDSGGGKHIEVSP
jgi:hypothetical protein